MKDYSQEFICWRVDNNVSQQEASKLVGCSPTTLSQYEKGVRRTIKFNRKIENFLKEQQNGN